MIWVGLRSGAKDMKSSQQYPRLFGEHVASHHLDYMKSATRHVFFIPGGWNMYVGPVLHVTFQYDEM